MKDSELLPCPFCGGEARLGTNFFADGFQVGCDNFECDLMPLTVIHDTEAGAVAAWNTRAETKAERDLRDEVNWLNAELHGAEIGRTCRITSAIILYDPDGYETALSCGHVVHMPPEDFDYCPCCGRKVV